MKLVNKDLALAVDLARDVGLPGRDDRARRADPPPGAGPLRRRGGRDERDQAVRGAGGSAAALASSRRGAIAPATGSPSWSTSQIRLAVQQQLGFGQRVAVEHDEVGELAGLDRADVIARARSPRAATAVAAQQRLVRRSGRDGPSAAARAPVSSPETPSRSEPSAIWTPAARAARRLSVPCSRLWCASVDDAREHLRRRRSAPLGSIASPEPAHPVVAAERRHQHLAARAPSARAAPGRWLRYMPCSIVSIPCAIAASVPSRPSTCAATLHAHPVRLVDERGELRVGQLRRLGILELVRARAGGHHLDEVRAVAQLLADGLADLVGAVGLAVHRAVEAAAGSGRGDDQPAGQQPRPAKRAVAHRLARLLGLEALRADVAQRRHAHPQRLAQARLQEVGAGAGQDRLGSVLGLRLLCPARGRGR